MLLGACAAPREDIAAVPAQLSGFQLGHVIIVADKATKSPVSRDATAEEWQAALTKAIQDRFGRIEGDKYYHFGISVDGYALAPPGIPLVAAPKSALILGATLWDDAKGGKVNAKPEQLIIFESLSGGTFVGTGYTKSREEQIEALAFNAALELERWLLKNPEWLPPPPAPVDGMAVPVEESVAPAEKPKVGPKSRPRALRPVAELGQRAARAPA